MSAKYNDEQIEQYLLGFLNEQERISFETLMEQNEDLKKEVSRQRMVIEELRKVDILLFQENLHEVTQSLQEQGFFLNDEDILDYLAGELAPEQAIIFERRLQNDPEFANRIEKNRELIKILKKSDLAFSKEKVQEVQSKLESEGFFDQPVFNQSKNVSKTRLMPIVRWTMAMAATLGFLAIVMWWLFRPSLEERLFAQNFTLLPDEVTRSINSSGFFSPPPEQKRDLTLAMEFYNKGNFRAASESFAVFKKNYPTSLYVVDTELYQGISLLALAQYSEAVTLLRPLSENKESEIVEQARWYLALGYMMMQEREEARQWLERIEPDSPYGPKAKALLKLF